MTISVTLIFIQLSSWLSKYRCSIHLSIHLSICLFVYLYLYLSVYLSIGSLYNICVLIYILLFHYTHIYQFTTITSAPTPIPSHLPGLWFWGFAARLRICADGGANRLFDALPALFPSEDIETVRKRWLFESWGGMRLGLVCMAFLRN